MQLYYILNKILNTKSPPLVGNFPTVENLCDKLSLNYKKTSFLVVNKFPPHSMNIDLEIFINNIKISCKKYVKYLGLWLDDDLKFHTYIHRLETHCKMY